MHRGAGGWERRSVLLAAGPADPNHTSRHGTGLGRRVRRGMRRTRLWRRINDSGPVGGAGCGDVVVAVGARLPSPPRGTPRRNPAPVKIVLPAGSSILTGARTRRSPGSGSTADGPAGAALQPPSVARAAQWLAGGWRVPSLRAGTRRTTRPVPGPHPVRAATGCRLRSERSDPGRRMVRRGFWPFSRPVVAGPGYRRGRVDGCMWVDQPIPQPSTAVLHCADRFSVGRASKWPRRGVT